ncbi:hypothetical protein EDB85DRAFT_1898184 [Lactarius pseudohatsudake]|nr:hypothetical protein EDB85DRAFT_1898184 [Lactarius pseudohatsudake]
MAIKPDLHENINPAHNNNTIGLLTLGRPGKLRPFNSLTNSDLSITNVYFMQLWTSNCPYNENENILYENAETRLTLTPEDEDVKSIACQDLMKERHCHSCPAPHSSCPTGRRQSGEVGVDHQQMARIAVSPQRKAGLAAPTRDPAAPAREPRASLHGSPHCTSTITVGGGGLMVIRGRRQSGRYRASLNSLQPLDGSGMKTARHWSGEVRVDHQQMAIGGSGLMVIRGRRRREGYGAPLNGPPAFGWWSDNHRAEFMNGARRTRTGENRHQSDKLKEGDKPSSSAQYDNDRGESIKRPTEATRQPVVATRTWETTFTSVQKSSPMNRKKTGTGPDCNRWQPDHRLRFIRFENLTGCGSSKSGIWVNCHRAGWDWSQPVFTATTTPVSTMTPTSLRPRIRHWADCSADADTNASGLNNNNRANTDSDDHDYGHDIDNDDNPQQRRPLQPQRRHVHNGGTSTAAPSTTTQAPPQRPQQQYINHHHHDQDDQDDDTSTPQERHIDNRKTPTAARTTHINSRNTDTPTAATSTHRQPQERHTDSRKNDTHQEPQHRHVDNHDDDDSTR